MKPAASLPPSYFDGVYANDPDPWGFATSAYERAKYAHTIASLPRPRYRRALEIGCSIGVLTELLAERCDALVALDVSASALRSARERCAGRAHVHFEQMQVPRELPAATFDLIVLSEVGYYWSHEDLEKAALWMVRSLRPSGVIVLVHWTDPVPDYPLTGDDVHRHFLLVADRAGLQRRLGEIRPRYRLDVLELRSNGA